MVDFHKALKDLRARRAAEGYEKPKTPEVLAQGPIKAWFRDHKGQIYSKELSYEILVQEHGIGIGHKALTWVVFQLRGGPTGFESFVLEDSECPADYSPTRAITNFERWGYWSACAGCHIYKECRIHVDEMRRVLTEYKENNPPPCENCGPEAEHATEDC